MTKALNKAFVITYIYDPLYRVMVANYSSSEFYHYTYDEVGNRLTEESHLESNAYVYDNANRLASVDTVAYSFDDNGNLLGNGTNTYTYDSANRLTSDGAISYTYNGLGDRYQQTISSTTTTYILDLNAGLTQVLDDGDNAYLYGLGRIAQVNTSTDYFMGDGLGSVRQLVDGEDIVLAKSYAPYGEDLYSTGSGESAFAYTGEQTDPNGLVYLRARYYGPGDGRFLSRDTWGGDYNNPVTLNRWVYANANPVNLVDLSGHSAGFLDPNGYSEGTMSNFTGLFLNWAVRGEELVYNFETLERAKFSLTARIDETTGEEHWVSGACASVIAISGATYTSTIFGFDRDGIVADYSGVTKSVGGGLNFVIPGAGVILFSSVDRGTSAVN